MQKVLPKQRDVQFLYIAAPTTIDKSAEWGPGNFQQFPSGAFLKVNSDGRTVSHGVQPNASSTAPVGWVASHTATTYDKAPIFVDPSRVYAEGETVELDTLDGRMDYVCKSPSVKVYNGEAEPNLKDVWLMSIRDLEKNYEVPEALQVQLHP